FTYTMTDAAGATSTATLTITIHGANDAPTISITTSTIMISAGDGFIRSGTFSDVDAGGSWTVTADYNEGAGFETVSYNPTTHKFTLSHEYVFAGTFTVTVHVTDLAGAVTEKVFTVVVS